MVVWGNDGLNIFTLVVVVVFQRLAARHPVGQTGNGANYYPFDMCK